MKTQRAWTHLWKSMPKKMRKLAPPSNAVCTQDRLTAVLSSVRDSAVRSHRRWTHSRMRTMPSLGAHIILREHRNRNPFPSGCVPICTATEAKDPDQGTPGKGTAQGLGKVSRMWIYGSVLRRKTNAKRRRGIHDPVYLRVVQARLESEQLTSAPCGCLGDRAHDYTYTPTLQKSATTPNPPSTLASNATPNSRTGAVLGSVEK